MASIYSNRATENRIDYVTTKTGIVGPHPSGGARRRRPREITCKRAVPGPAADAGHYGKLKPRR